MREKLLGEDHGDVAQSFHNIAAVYNEQRSYEQAVECMKKALEIRYLFKYYRNVHISEYRNYRFM